MQSATDVAIDVSEAAGLGGSAEIVATVYMPDASLLSDRPTVCFAFPGGGYGRRYWSMDFPDEGSGGQAGWHTSRGWVFVAVDHLQVGDSTTFDPDLLTFEAIVSANAIAVSAVLARLAEGTVTDTLPPITAPTVVGIGQSMGGCFTLVLQAHHRCFDAIGILGYSAIHTVVPSRPGTPDLAMPWMTRTGYPSTPVVLNPEVLAEPTSVGDSEDLATAVDEGEHMWTWAFHSDAEPRELVETDMAAMTGGPVPPWRSATSPACAILMVAPGAVATEAAAITVPVFVGVGEIDVVPDPWVEPKAYKSCADITVFVCPTMAHMHNFAPTRERFWSRLHSWAEAVSDTSPNVRTGV
jgi:pimeloyl-ACP methyl ester carboxylesterase